MGRFRAWVAGAALLTGAVFAAAPVGRPLLGPLLSEQQRQVYQTNEARQKAEKGIPYTALGEQPSLGAEANASICFPIRRIETDPYRLLDRREVEAILREYRGRCDTIADLLEMVRRISNLYIRGSYITSLAYLRPQDLSDGVLRLSIIEGSVGRVLGAGVNPSPVFLGVSGEPLSLRDLETRLDLLNRMGSLRTTMKMLPGAKTGQTDLLLRGERIGSRWHGSLGMNNFGYRPTGRVQLSGTLGIDNLLGINDVLDLHLNTTDRARNSLSRGLSYRFPLGKNLLTLSYTYYHYRQRVPGTLQEYLSEGRSRDLELKVERELFHTLTQKGVLSAGIARRINTNALAGVRLESSDSRLTVARLGYTHSFTGQRSEGFAALELQQGLRLFRTRAPLGTKATFSKLLLDLGWTRRFARRSDGFYAAWNLSAHGQWSGRDLPGSEMISVGGPYSVRGFRETGQLSGNTGGYLRSELSLHLPWSPGYLAPYLALDLGHVRHNRRSVGGTIAGAAAGLRFGGKTWHLDLYAAYPLHDSNRITRYPNGEVTVRPRKGSFGFSLSYRF